MLKIVMIVSSLLDPSAMKLFISNDEFPTQEACDKQRPIDEAMAQAVFYQVPGGVKIVTACMPTADAEALQKRVGGPGHD